MEDVLRETWEALEARLQHQAQAEKDPRIAALKLLSCLTILVQLLGSYPSKNPSALASVMGATGHAIRHRAQLQVQEVVSAVWMPALQAISSVHVATLKVASLTGLGRTERHAVKNALATFNHQVELVLGNGYLRVALHLRPALVEASLQFVVPPYADFIGKFATLNFSGRYLLFTAQSLRDVMSKHLFGGSHIGNEMPLETPLATPR
ncbi:hypothetical protein T484DRAFT_1900611 [Baffinella frigidus]|nr:hypothetical protein T484DRAFT_1900611 [Cryptophyta sp. CCMP2293]